MLAHLALTIAALSNVATCLAREIPQSGPPMDRRQVANATTTNATASVSLALPSGSPTSSSTTLDLSRQYIDRSIFELEDDALEFSCKNCTTTGSLELTATELTVDDSCLDQNVSCIESGSFDVQIEGLSAHKEFEVASGTFSKSFNLFKVPVCATCGITTGVGTAGLYAEVNIDVAINMTEILDITFGFDFAMPPNASLFMDLADLSNSSAYGFTPAEGLQVSLLPLQFNISAVALSASIAFKPVLVFGITALDGVFAANVDAAIDVPTISMEVQQLSGVDENCNPLTGSSTVNDIIGKFLGNLTNIVPSASIDLAVGADLGAHVDGHGFDDTAGVTLLASTTALPTACLKYDQDSGTFAAASLPASVTAAVSAASTHTSKHSGAEGLPPPEMAMIIILGFFSGAVLLV